MAKQKPKAQPVEINRGTVKDNYLAALVTSPVGRTRRVESKKAYTRKAKHRGYEGFALAA